MALQRTVPALPARRPAHHHAPWRRLAAALCGLPALLPLSALAVAAASAPAAAELRVCNRTANLVSVAIGYWSPDEAAWISEGWWNVPADRCGAVIPGTLTQRYYYVYAVDTRAGVEWSDTYFMCTQAESFLLAGVDNCIARGLRRTGFFQVDTGEERELYQVVLTPGAASPTGAAPAP